MNNKKLRNALLAIFVIVLVIGSATVLGYRYGYLVYAASNSQNIQDNTVVVAPTTSSYKSLVVPNCYSLIVNVTALNNSTIPQSISFQSFYIVIVLPNQPVANTTNTVVFSSNNRVGSILLFPPSPNPIPVVMEISFNNVCLPNGTNPQNDIKLVYFDGVTYRSWIPSINTATKTITWL